MADNEILSWLPARLLPWYRKNARDLPWRKDRVPYHVWLSEIMLQQTRVEAVRGYYDRFLQAFPTVEDLAKSDDERLMKLWEGLGYYSRARNLKKTAQIISFDLGGEFPQSVRALKELPGIGAYTAGAIASICFDERAPAVDGNVLRVCTRLCACEKDVTDEKVKAEIADALSKIYPDCAGEFTQSLMELGATVCLPNAEPLCDVCPMRELCLARAQGKQRSFPVKQPKKARRTEKRTVFILSCSGRYALVKRQEKGLLAGLWQFPDTVGELSAQQALDLLSSWGLRPTELLKAVEKKHIFTHITWQMTGYYVCCGEMPERFVWADAGQILSEYSVPTAFRQFFDET